MQNNDIVIVSAKRTPSGNMLGGLSSLSANELGAHAIRAALEAASVDGNDIDEVIMGCVLQAAQGQAPARQALIKADVPNHVGATTINKMCGSGMKAVMLANDLIKAESGQIIIAGGFESMSNAPYLVEKARQGYRLGHGALKDHMFLDGLEDAYERGQLMGVFAENTAKHFKFTREAQDEFAIESLKRALNASERNAFEAEITPVTITNRKGEITISKDEGPDESKLSKIPKLRPAFAKDGTVTAANSSSISDGAAAIILMPYQVAKAKNITPLAKICGHSTHAHEPAWFTTAPVKAIENVLAKTNWKKDDVDLYEINEAFAVVTMAAIHELKLDHSKVNVHGGACALGHPIGASGSRILTTLIHALKSGEKGVASLCIGGGEATAMAIEKL